MNWKKYDNYQTLVWFNRYHNHYICASLKKIATILCILFVMVQVAPAICTVLQIETGLFLVDEEKSPEKTATAESKDIKSCLAIFSYNEILDSKLNAAYHHSEKIQLSPFLEKLTPPPNFS